MIIIQEPHISDNNSCAYIEGETCRFQYFFALDLNENELDVLLSSGWRKFGVYYFRPDCGKCFKCIPIRILTGEFSASKSQRRVLRKSSEIEVKFGPLEFKEEIYDIYREHSKTRFGNETEREDFISTFYTRTCPAYQSEYYLNNELIGVGFLDRSSQSLSSVYFIYRTDFMDYNPGTYSILKEIEFAAGLGLPYYYLGYYIAENPRMSYKNQFFPNEKYDWNKGLWLRDEKP